MDYNFDFKYPPCMVNHKTAAHLLMPTCRRRARFRAQQTHFWSARRSAQGRRQVEGRRRAEGRIAETSRRTIHNYR